MKKLVVKDYVELELREAQCDFCQESKECIKSSISKSIPKLLEVSVNETKNYGSRKYVFDAYDTKYDFFGKEYFKSDGVDSQRIYTEDDIEKKEYYKKLYEKEYSSDICKDCIKQLAKLV